MKKLNCFLHRAIRFIIPIMLVSVFGSNGLQTQVQAVSCFRHTGVEVAAGWML